MTHEHPNHNHLHHTRAYIIERMAKLAVIRKQADWEWNVLVEQRIKIDEELKSPRTVSDDI